MGLSSTKEKPKDFVMPKTLSPQYLQTNDEESFFRRLKTLPKRFIVISGLLLGVFVGALIGIFIGFIYKRRTVV